MLVYFLFSYDQRRPSFFFPPAQAFTKWPPVFSGETRRNSVVNGFCAGRSRPLLPCGDAARRGGVKFPDLAGSFVCGVIFQSTKESCDLASSDILSRLVGGDRGLVSA